METIINATAPEFKVQAFQNGEFKTVSSEQYQAKTSKASGLSSSSIQLTSHSFVLLNL